MKTHLVSLAVVASLAVAALSSRGERPVPERMPESAPNAEGTRLVNRLPVAFVPNLGQWHGGARYVAKVGAMTVFLEEAGWSFTLVERTSQGKKESREPRHDDGPARGVAVRMTFVGAQQPELVAEQVLPGKHNYFLGNDATKWRSDVPLYGSVRYRGMHDGVDVRAREHDGHFEYDLLLQPGADLEPVEIVVDGCDRLHIDQEGSLVMTTALGPVRMPVPVSWEEGPVGERSKVACSYELRGSDRFGFTVSGRRQGWALVVDPGLVYSTYLGGASWDSAYALALDAQGAATVAGNTASTNFPTTPGSFDTNFNGVDDAFITRLSPTGATLVYSTFLGGTGDDIAYALALDAQGAATVTGQTGSLNFPMTPGSFDTTHNGVIDAFITRLSPTGASLVYSTFLGGTDLDAAYALALDAQGAATVAGHTYSTDFSTTPGSFDTTFNGSGYSDAFITRLSPTGASLVYSTFLGGTVDDYPIAIALDAHGAATVAGDTQSSNFPTTPGSFDTTHNGASDAFITRLSPTGASLVYSTLLGGTDHDTAWALALDAQGAATVAGLTYSTNFPTTPGSFDTTFNSLGSYSDAFITRLSPTGASLVYSTFLGGVLSDYGFALALDAQGAATVAGDTQSSNFPTTPGSFDTTHNGASDAFITRLDMLPNGVAAFGASSPGCTGPLAISVTSMPRVGNSQFAFTCGNAAPSSVGLIAFSSARLQSPIPALGVDIWLDPTTLLVSATVTSNAIGACDAPLPIANNPALAGLRLFTQFLWLGPTAPPPCPGQGFSTSNALDFTIQP